MNKRESEKLDKQVLKALNEKCPPEKHWEYINWLIAADLIGPDYVSSDKYAERQSRNQSRVKLKITNKEIYDKWEEMGMPPLTILAKEFNVSRTTITKAISTYIEDNDLEDMREKKNQHQGRPSTLWKQNK